MTEARPPVAQQQPAAPATRGPSSLSRGSEQRSTAAVAGPRPKDGSAFGLAPLRLELDGQKRRVTERPVETISGKVLGRPAARLVVQVGDSTEEIAVDRGAFSTSVRLHAGLNEVRVVATDDEGMTSEATVTIEHVPPRPADMIAIVSPQDGAVLPADGPPVVLVEGRVDDPTVVQVRLAVNDHTVSAPVVDGRFRLPVPVLAPMLRLQAEAVGTDGTGRRSRAVTVNAAMRRFADAVVILDGVDPNVAAAVNVTWRSNPGRVDVKTQPVRPLTVPTAAGEALPGVFYIRNPTAGVYTIVLKYDNHGDQAKPLGGTVYVPSDGKLGARTLRPVVPNGTGSAVIGRLLLPYGVLWDQSDWFTGQSATAETITKFRFPEGVGWTERRSDLAR